MNHEELKKQYDRLFPSEFEKAQAFDELAERFYFCNFGSMQKSDIDLLMFSLYLDRILEQSEENMQEYSDYTLSKYLGITQTRISGLKVKKELVYPYEKFDWRASFQRIVNNARYENGKIKLYIPDKNLYLEIKNAIEVAGGFVEVQYNSSLLQVAPEYFIDLLLVTSGDKERSEIRDKLKAQLKDKNIDTKFLEAPGRQESIAKKIGKIGLSATADLIETCVPIVGKMVAGLIRASLDAYDAAKEGKK